jgi:dTDP-4-dehydrorhamnose reductase
MISNTEFIKTEFTKPEFINLIVFGANGMLGRYVSVYFSNFPKYNVINVTRKEYEINANNLSNLENFLIEKGIDENTWVINCVGAIPQREKTTIEKTLKNLEEYYIINTTFPLLLSNICYKYNAKMIHPTTDCVYSGKTKRSQKSHKEGSNRERSNREGLYRFYLETDFPDETSPYGISKWLGEPKNCIVLRTSIIGEEKYNKLSLLEWVKNSRDSIQGWTNHYWNGITCLQWSKIAHQIIENIIENKTENKTKFIYPKLYHIVSPDVRSKYDLAVFIKEAYNLTLNIIPTESPESIDKTLGTSYNIFNIPPLKEQIHELSKYK